MLHLNENYSNSTPIAVLGTVQSSEMDYITSLQISELTGKQHAHIMRDIRNLLEQGVAESNFGLGSYTDANNQQRPCYNLTKKGCLILASGYDAVLREKIINRWEELENKRKESFPVPQSFGEALMLAAQQQIQIEAQQKQLMQKEEEIIELKAENVELQKQSEYTRVILQSKQTVLVTQIAQDYGMSARKFNLLLRDLGIQHKVRNQWILYGKYLNKGYVHSTTHNYTHTNGSPDVSLNTEWTQKGRLFLYEELKKHSFIPLIEREMTN